MFNEKQWLSRNLRKNYKNAYAKKAHLNWLWLLFCYFLHLRRSLSKQLGAIALSHLSFLLIFLVQNFILINDHIKTWVWNWQKRSYWPWKFLNPINLAIFLARSSPGFSALFINMLTYKPSISIKIVFSRSFIYLFIYLLILRVSDLVQRNIFSFADF